MYPPLPVHDPRPLLDIATERQKAYDRRPWGWRPALVPCLTLAVLVVVGSLVGYLAHPAGAGARLVISVVVNVGLYLVLGVAVYRAGQPVAERYGGWGNAFGLRRPRWRDVPWVLAGVGISLVGRLIVGIVAVTAAGSDAVKQSQNISGGSRSVAAYVVLGVVVVLLAPVIEETVFRGLMLRAFMRRTGFWPAALASTAIFALFHTYEVSTLAGAIILACSVGTLGLTNCLLVRWTERLTPGIGVHMVSNALALVVLILQN